MALALAVHVPLTFRFWAQAASGLVRTSLKLESAGNYRGRGFLVGSLGESESDYYHDFSDSQADGSDPDSEVTVTSRLVLQLEVVT